MGILSHLILIVLFIAGVYALCEAHNKAVQKERARQLQEQRAKAEALRK